MDWLGRFGTLIAPRFPGSQGGAPTLPGPRRLLLFPGGKALPLWQHAPG